MVINFPSASVGQTYQTGSSATYIWNGSYWDVTFPANITVLNSTTASYAISSSYAANGGGGGGGAAFPFTGSAAILGELSNGLNLTITSGSYSHVEGRSTNASGAYSHAEGSSSIASGSASHAEGFNATASGIYSHAEGGFSRAAGAYSHAEGFSTVASNTSAHAEGTTTLASGVNSHSEGLFTTASGASSHAEGSGSISSGIGAHSEGQWTTASANYSHTEGRSTIAAGWYSHAEGSGSQTSLAASASSAQGIFTVASGSGQTVIGQYNMLSNSTRGAFIIGNGISTSSRSDLLRTSGSQIEITGSLILTGSLVLTGSLNVNGNITYSSSTIIQNYSIESYQRSTRYFISAKKVSAGTTASFISWPTSSAGSAPAGFTNTMTIDYTIAIAVSGSEDYTNSGYRKSLIQLTAGSYGGDGYMASGNSYSTPIAYSATNTGDTWGYNNNDTTFDHKIDNTNGPYDIDVVIYYIIYNMDSYVSSPNIIS